MNSYEKGKATELIASQHFERQGYRILKRTVGTGPDLVVMLDGVVSTVEVKPAVRNGGSWITPPVYPTRISDDLVAIVLPDHSVEVRTMAEHLRLAAKDTTCAVTSLVRSRCASIDPGPYPRRPRWREPHSKNAREEIIERLRLRGGVVT